ncbi:hypothetical protein CORC01_10870 [Colletotrichum orchidophilum]|uniref:Uncharacterized protein n=1 Tax=Colletotrichum orchidophilum TaxID=1209926 RepID=A0A1G4AXG1_9PEZI|nr:uncharacterized protein CORC01_10870 [Colletotrichum orchidophilum]OHE93849.1 hypothetical protein CORC01_10870 [Colletotrichum orchidophilum]
MCDYEELFFPCEHSASRKKSYCHFARNDPMHQCFSVKILKKVWPQGRPYDSCTAALMQPGPAS